MINMASFKINYNDIIRNIERQYMKNQIQKIEVGDTVKVQKIIQEGTKERIQISEGVIISKKHTNLNQTVTIRKVVQGIGVERVYLIHSPQILAIEVVRKSQVRKAKLYYLRYRSGKATRLRQKAN